MVNYINKIGVTQREWKELVDYFPAARDDPAGPFADQKFTQAELSDLLRTTKFDVNGRRFAKLSHLLSLYNFELLPRARSEGKVPKSGPLYEDSGSAPSDEVTRFDTCAGVISRCVDWGGSMYTCCTPLPIDHSQDEYMRSSLRHTFIGNLESRSPEEADRLWTKVREIDDWAALFPSGGIETYAGLKAALHRDHDIDFIGRLGTTGALHAILSNRQSPQKTSTRPRAVLIYPKIDKDQTFSHGTPISKMVSLGYEVHYYEASIEAEIVKALSQATHGGQYRAQVIILAGQGDIQGKTNIPVADYVEASGYLVLESNSDSQNLADRVAGHLPQGVTIYATRKPSVISSVRLQNGKFHVNYPDDALYTTHGSR